MSIMSMPTLKPDLLPSILGRRPSSQERCPIVGRKRYLEDLELPEVHDSKRAKVAGSSIPSSPTSPVSSSAFTSPNIAEPLINQPAHPFTSSPSQYQYLSHSESRYYSSSTKHSLDYPDTCINDEDWRYNLEFWINKNFPEKFQTLKNVLKLDKPGFDLLNDAILISELKEQLDTDQEKKIPKFNSKISKKMTSSYNKNLTGRKVHGYSSRYISSASTKAILSENGSLSEDEGTQVSKIASFNRSTSSGAQSSVGNSSSVQSAPLSSTSKHYTYTNSQLISPPLANANLSTGSVQQPLKPAVFLNSPKVTLPPLNIKEYTQTSLTSSSSSSSTYPLSPKSLIPNQSKPMSSPVRYDTSSSATASSYFSSSSQNCKPASPTASSPVLSEHQQQSSSPLKTNFVHTMPHKSPNHSYTIHHHTLNKRQCISCHSDQSPCWRPSWSLSAGQLCNSCGLRYKKTGARCINSTCGRIPAKGEWTAMKNRGKVMIYNGVQGGDYMGYHCLHCDSEVEVKMKNDPKP